jgi:hypothetical protein
MLPEHFSNPPAEGKLNGNNSIEAGLSEMLQRFETGRLQIFSSCIETLEEMRLYHRKNGKVVAIKDDLISAMRYAVLSVERFGEKLKNKTQYRRYGFEQEIKYSSSGIV